MKTRILMGASVLALTCGVAGAQTPAPTPTPAPEPTAKAAQGSEEVIVTSRRRDENVRKVPSAITVFSPKDRDRLGIRTMQDFTNFTPGLSFNSSNDRAAIRGVGRLTNLVGSDPGVATYNDGFYTADTAEASKTPMFVGRIEVLRGPQGTLYGRNSIGGALNVISARPTDEFQGEVRSTIEQGFGGAIAEGYISGPIVGNLKGRLSIQGGPWQLEAPYKNTAVPNNPEGYRDRFFVEAQLQYDFSEKTQLWVKYSHAEWDDHMRSGNVVTPYFTSVPAPNTKLGVFPPGALVPNATFGYTGVNPGITDRHKFATNTWASQKVDKNHVFVVNFKTDLGGTTLKYVGGYSTYLYTSISDLDDSPVNLVTTNVGTFFGNYTYNPTYVQEYIQDKTHWSNEITLSNTTPGAFNWVVGLYQYREHYYQPISWYVDGAATDDLSKALAAPINIIGGGLAAPNPRRSFYEGTGDLRVNSYAAFGQFDYEFAPGWKLTAGLRYSSDEKNGRETYRIINWDPTAALAGCFGAGCGKFTPAMDVTTFVTGAGNGSGGAARNLEGKWDGWSWHLGLNWKPDEDTMVYASYSRGLKSGGFSMNSWADQPYVRMETADAYEIGIKTKPADGFFLNAAAFYYSYKDMQVPINVRVKSGLSPAGFDRDRFFNIPGVSSRGFEVEAKWLPNTWLEMRLAYGYLDTEVTDGSGVFDGFGNAVNTKGNELPQASRHKVAVSALFDIPIESGNLFLATSYVYRSSAYYSLLNTPQYRAPSWDQVDMRLTYIDPSERVTLIAYCRNLFDSVGYVGAGGGATGSTLFQGYSYTEGRSLGFEMQFKF